MTEYKNKNWENCCDAATEKGDQLRHLLKDITQMYLQMMQELRKQDRRCESTRPSLRHQKSKSSPVEGML